MPLFRVPGTPAVEYGSTPTASALQTAQVKLFGNNTPVLKAEIKRLCTRKGLHYKVAAS